MDELENTEFLLALQQEQIYEMKTGIFEGDRTTVAFLLLIVIYGNIETNLFATFTFSSAAGVGDHLIGTCDGHFDVSFRGVRQFMGCWA